MKSTRPDLGNSTLGSVLDGKREPKREKTVLVPSIISVTSPSASSAKVSILSPANSSVLATPLGVLGVAVKRSSDRETDGRPPKPGLSSSESSVGMEFVENGLAVEVEVDVVDIVVEIVVKIVVVGEVEMNVVLTGSLELVAALVTELLVVTELEVEDSAGAEVTRLKSKPKSEGTELLSSVPGLLLVVVLPPSGATISGLIGISKGMVIRAMLGAVTVGKVTLGKVTLPSKLAIVVPLTSTEPLVSPETMDRSKKFEDLGSSLKKLGSVTRVVEDASDVTKSESIETTKGLGDRVG